MGEVYRAKDPRLAREVAIKVLPASFSQDADRLRRFEQEAKAAGVLNHPNITAVYDIGQHDGAPYVVQELLEGETLREELAAGRFSSRKAIEYALQIAQGLAAAHEKGIVHRDLKPENLFVTKDGRIKILDFGLAKLTEIERGDQVTNLPTAAAATEPGVVMGTLGYMSPEQVKGRPADARSDIFAFGAVLYEMLSGKRAFHGDSAGETMASILKEDPADLSVTNQNISPGLERIVRHCLEKSPERRFQSSSDIAFALQSLSEGSGSVVPGALAPRARRIPRGVLWGIAGGLLTGAIAATLLTLGHGSSQPSAGRPVRFEVAAPENDRVVGTLALSPDGSRLAFTAREPDGAVMLWIRPLADPRAEKLPGTEGAELPFWSPDGRSVGFFAGGQLKRISVSGGSPQSIAPVTTDVRGASWGADDRIVFAPAFAGPLLQVAASGGQVTPASTLNKARSEGTHRWPWFLPDGRHFLYYSAPSTGVEPGEIFLARLGSSEAKRITESDSLPVYAPGYLVFVRGSTLVAQPFDIDRQELRGEPTALGVELPSNISTSGQRALSASQDGTLGWHTQASVHDPTRPDRPPGARSGEARGAGALVPDFAFRRTGDEWQRHARPPETTVGDIWVIDVERNVATRTTLDPADENYPIWSPDGSRLVFGSSRKGAAGDLYVMRADQAGTEELLLASEPAKTTDSWSPDGRYVIFEVSTPRAGRTCGFFPSREIGSRRRIWRRPSPNAVPGSLPTAATSPTLLMSPARTRSMFGPSANPAGRGGSRTAAARLPPGEATAARSTTSRPTTRSWQRS